MAPPIMFILINLNFTLSITSRFILSRSEEPAEGTPESSLYKSESSVDDSRVLSFHTVNLYRKYGESWRDIASEKVHRRMHSWGFNTIGNWSDSRIYFRRETPYVLTINSGRTGLIADPYLPTFKDDLLKTLAARKEEMDDPWCIGVFIDNELKWGVKWAPKIAEQIQEAPEDTSLNEIIKIASEYRDVVSLNWYVGW